jgi:hypothetical protein
MMQGISFSIDGPVMTGTWYNPKNGDSFTVRDTYFEDNQYMVITTDGRRMDYNMIQNYIKSGMNKVAAFYRLFFEGSLDAIFKVIEGVSSIADGNAGESSYLLENRVEGNNNIVINVDLSDSSSDALIKAVTALRESESGIVAKMEETNKKLEEVAKTI